MTVVKFPSKKPAPQAKAGPYWAGQPLKEAFPRMPVRTSEQAKARRRAMLEGELHVIEPDGPEGAA